MWARDPPIGNKKERGLTDRSSLTDHELCRVALLALT